MATTSLRSMPVPVPRVADLTPQQRQRAVAAMRQGFTLCDLLRLSRPEPLITVVGEMGPERLAWGSDGGTTAMAILLYWAAFYPPQTTPVKTITQLVTACFERHAFENEDVQSYLSDILPLLLYPTRPMGDSPASTDYSDLLSNKTRLYAMFPWMPKFFADVQLFRQWFHWAVGFSAVTQDITRRMSEFIAKCDTTDLAPWATYTGTIYRGVRRSLDEAKAYDFTKAEVRTLSRWRTVSFRTSYRSQYPVQSWTTSWNRAVGFADKGAGTDWWGAEGLVVPVVFTSHVTRQNSLFSPAVSNVIARKLISVEEDEVLRTVSTPDPAMTGIILLDDHRPWWVYRDWWDSGVFPASVMEVLRASWRGVTK